jgi:glycosyltransferase involved in cell wall biosynthesis
VPYIAYLHGGDLPKRFVKSPRISQKYILGAAEVVSPSGYLHFAVKENFSRNAAVIPNYLDLKNYTFKQRTQNRSLQILWVRSFHASYQPELAIQTVAILKQHGVAVKLAMVGPNKYGSLEKCQSLANELGIAEYIEFTGRLPKEEWLKKSVDFNVFLNTTSVDNTPVSVMEAMALGMPVVTTKVGGIPFLFEDGKEGIMVQEQTSKALGEALISMMKDGDKTEAISRAARKKAEEWDWSVVREQWLTLFNSI